MSKRSTRLKATAKELLGMTLGVAFASIGLKAFLLPNGFLDGGVTGVALLLNRLTGINISLSILALSIPFLTLAWFTLSRRVVIKSLASVVALAFLLEFESFTVITEDKLLIAIFGGLCLGFGIGLTIRNGAVLDGAEVLGIYGHDRFGISIGSINLAFNVVLFGVTAAVVSTEVAMYSILTFLVAAKVIDAVVAGFDDFIGVTIVSPEHARIREAVIEELGAGLTLYRGQGGFGSRSNASADTIILQTVVNRIEIRRLHRLVTEIDENAFMLEFEVHHVTGGVVRRYLERPSKVTKPVAV